MICGKCGSNNVNVQVVTETKIKNKHHGCIWWAFFGWYWVPFKWFCLTVPALIFKIFAPKRQKITNKQKTVCVCQNCGNTWNA